MTPRELSTGSITKRLILMNELLEDLQAMEQVTSEELRTERLRRRALERILTQLVEIAVDINQHVSSASEMPVGDYRSSFDAAARAGLIPEGLAGALKPSVGLRNVLTHEYVNVDLDLVAAAVPTALKDYGTYVATVAKWLTARG